MVSVAYLLEQINNGQLDESFSLLYADVSAARSRAETLCGRFLKLYGDLPEAALVSTPGRTEICGNHTDHNNGLVAAASVELDVLMVAAPSGSAEVRVDSTRFPEDILDIADLSVRESEKAHSVGLIRGVCAALAANGRKTGGFYACADSRVFGGSGLSSSAAFEVAVAECINVLFNGGAIEAVELAKAGQYAENVYYGKPCGLLDQTACAVGGFVALDFEHTGSPVVQQTEFDLDGMSLGLCVLETGGSHADLTDDYAAIPAEMKAVARFFGKQVLRETTREQVIENAAAIRKNCGDRALLRSLHYFAENDRVKTLLAAVAKRDSRTFCETVNASGISSYMYNQNAYSTHSDEQGIAVAYALSRELLGDRGCYRLQGGGFAGTLQVFCPTDYLRTFKLESEKVFGEDRCHIISVRNYGAVSVTGLA